jgi:hypothetical protein
MDAVTLEIELIATFRGSRSDVDMLLVFVAVSPCAVAAGADEKSDWGMTDARCLRRMPNMGK